MTNKKQSERWPMPIAPKKDWTDEVLLQDLLNRCKAPEPLDVDEIRNLVFELDDQWIRLKGSLDFTQFKVVDLILRMAIHYAYLRSAEDQALRKEPKQ